MRPDDKEVLAKALVALQRQINVLNLSRTVGGPHQAIIDKLRSQRDEIIDLLHQGMDDA